MYLGKCAYVEFLAQNADCDFPRDSVVRPVGGHLMRRDSHGPRRDSHGPRNPVNPGEGGAAEDEKPYRTPFASAPDNPWWILPLLGRVPAVPPPKIQLLGVIALALLFENYDQAMLTAAAK